MSTLKLLNDLQTRPGHPEASLKALEGILRRLDIHTAMAGTVDPSNVSEGQLALLYMLDHILDGNTWTLDKENEID